MSRLAKDNLKIKQTILKTIDEVGKTNLKSCPHCSQFVTKYYLKDHSNHCKYKMNKVFLENSAILEGNLTPATGYYGEDVQNKFLKKVLPAISRDLREIVKTDPDLMGFGKSLCKQSTARKPSNLTWKLKRLSELKIHLKSKLKISDSSACLGDLLVEKNVDEICSFAFTIEKASIQSRSSKAIKFGETLKLFFQHLHAEATNKEAAMMWNSEKAETERKHIEAFSRMFKTEWLRRAVEKAHFLENIDITKLLPLVESIKQFHDALSEEVVAAAKGLKEKPTRCNWEYLARTLMVKINAFNRRRLLYSSMMKLEHFSRKTLGSEADPDLMAMLTVSERIVAQNIAVVKVETRDYKRIPVMLTDDFVDYINLLKNTRKVCRIRAENPYIFPLKKTLPMKLRPITKDIVNLIEKKYKLEEKGMFTMSSFCNILASTIQLLNIPDHEIGNVGDRLAHCYRADFRRYKFHKAAGDLAKMTQILLRLDNMTEECDGSPFKAIHLPKNDEILTSKVGALDEYASEDSIEAIPIKNDTVCSSKYTKELDPLSIEAQDPKLLHGQPKNSYLTPETRCNENVIELSEDDEDEFIQEAEGFEQFATNGKVIALQENFESEHAQKLVEDDTYQKGGVEDGTRYIHGNPNRQDEGHASSSFMSFIEATTIAENDFDSMASSENSDKDFVELLPSQQLGDMRNVVKLSQLVRNAMNKYEKISGARISDQGIKRPITFRIIKKEKIELPFTIKQEFIENRNENTESSTFVNDQTKNNRMERKEAMRYADNKRKEAKFTEITQSSSPSERSSLRTEKALGINKVTPHKKIAVAYSPPVAAETLIQPIKLLTSPRNITSSLPNFNRDSEISFSEGESSSSKLININGSVVKRTKPRFLKKKSPTRPIFDQLQPSKQSENAGEVLKLPQLTRNALAGDGEISLGRKLPRRRKSPIKFRSVEEEKMEFFFNIKEEFIEDHYEYSSNCENTKNSEKLEVVDGRKENGRMEQVETVRSVDNETKIGESENTTESSPSQQTLLTIEKESSLNKKKPQEKATAANLSPVAVEKLMPSIKSITSQKTVDLTLPNLKRESEAPSLKENMSLRKLINSKDSFSKTETSIQREKLTTEASIDELLPSKQLENERKVLILRGLAGNSEDTGRQTRNDGIERNKTLGCVANKRKVEEEFNKMTRTKDVDKLPPPSERSFLIMKKNLSLKKRLPQRNVVIPVANPLSEPGEKLKGITNQTTVISLFPNLKRVLEASSDEEIPLRKFITSKDSISKGTRFLKRKSPTRASLPDIPTTISPDLRTRKRPSTPVAVTTDWSLKKSARTKNIAVKSTTTRFIPKRSGVAVKSTTARFLPKRSEEAVRSTRSGFPPKKSKENESKRLVRILIENLWAKGVPNFQDHPKTYRQPKFSLILGDFVYNNFGGQSIEKFIAENDEDYCSSDDPNAAGNWTSNSCKNNIMLNCRVNVQRVPDIERLFHANKSIKKELLICELCEPKRIFLSKNAWSEHIMKEHISRADMLEMLLDRLS